MAIQTMRPWQIADGQAYIELDYDDVDRLTRAFRWANNLPRDVVATITRSDGTVLLNQRAAPGTSGGGNITGPRRWNIDVDPWPIAVNLAS